MTLNQIAHNTRAGDAKYMTRRSQGLDVNCLNTASALASNREWIGFGLSLGPVSSALIMTVTAQRPHRQ